MAETVSAQTTDQQSIPGHIVIGLGCLLSCLIYLTLSWTFSPEPLFDVTFLRTGSFNASEQANDQRISINRINKELDTNSTISDQIYQRLTIKVRKKVHFAELYLKQEKLVHTIDLNQTRCPTDFVAVHQSQGRLGNLLFQTASLLGIAKTVKKLPIFISKNRRHDIFAGFWIPYFFKEVFEGCRSCGCNRTLTEKNAVTLEELGAGTYSPNFTAPEVAERKGGYILHGWLQSYRYFRPCKRSIKMLFTFTEKVYEIALRLLRHEISKYQLKNPSKSSISPVLIGVHVRRGDFAKNPATRAAGLLPAPDAYLFDSLTELRLLHSTAIFLVASDDRKYCLKLFRKHPDVVILAGYTAPVHLAVLTLMEHLVITTGSFGWWAAYLSAAKSVRYYADYPAPWSRYKKEFPKDDYFLAEWIGRTANQTESIFSAGRPQ